ncbi:hypothetical protein BKA69DRAFT_1037529 [Paraphysoderma sedebokerense]|nr:hypothetical protein BKA69DRAFT_1037520 [Paraphysoderma sedebokerense]KAI9142502.1 hypothetical protein BKA69DRAFT_1037529 [Paraphysoderma sedebokerense]
MYRTSSSEYTKLEIVSTKSLMKSKFGDPDSRTNAQLRRADKIVGKSKIPKAVFGRLFEDIDKKHHHMYEANKEKLFIERSRLQAALSTCSIAGTSLKKSPVRSAVLTPPMGKSNCNDSTDRIEKSNAASLPVNSACRVSKQHPKPYASLASPIDPIKQNSTPAGERVNRGPHA